MSLENTDAGTPVEPTVADVPASGAPSMEDTLKSTYRELMAKGESDEGAEDTAAPTEGRARASDGKFLPSKANGNAQAAASTQEEVATETLAQPAVANLNPDNLQRRDGTGPVDITKAPGGWRGDVKAPFESLPDTVRREIHKREDDFYKGLGQYKEAADFGQQMAQELSPFHQTMQQHNLQPREVVKALGAAWNKLVTGSPQEKAGLVLQLVKDYGIDFASLGANPPQGQAQPTQEDPRLVAALQRLEKIEGNLTAQERQRAEAEYATHVESVNKFGSDPKHEHFNVVRAEMAALLNSGQATDLKEAYDKAIWVNPEVRGSLLAKQEKERADKLAREAADARKAAGANVTRRGTPPVPPKTGSIEDTIKGRYRELMS